MSDLLELYLVFGLAVFLIAVLQIDLAWETESRLQGCHFDSSRMEEVILFPWRLFKLFAGTLVFALVVILMWPVLIPFMINDYAHGLD